MAEQVPADHTKGQLHHLFGCSWLAWRCLLGVGGAHKLAEITLQKAPSSSRVKDASWARDLGPASDGISAN